MSAVVVTERYQKRILNDIRDLYTDPVEGIYVVPDDDKITLLHALIIGPEGTPYEGGFFYFLVEFPEKYPLSPPKVKLMTTGNGSVRFNPNLYNNGKVCLSILGTWSGPGWTSVMTTKSVLISIQSLMNEHPFYNEPGFEGGLKDGRYKVEDKAYNERITYEKIRVAVIQMVENSLPSASSTTNTGPPSTAPSTSKAPVNPPMLSSSSLQSSSSSSSSISSKAMKSKASAAAALKKKMMAMEFGPFGVFSDDWSPISSNNLSKMPDLLKQMIIKEFCKRKDFYLEVCENNKSSDGKQIFDKYYMDFMGGSRGSTKYNYATMAKRINELRFQINLDENMADQLYESLVSCYRRRGDNGGESSAANGDWGPGNPNEIFEPDDDVVEVSSDDDNDDCVIIDVDDDDDDDDGEAMSTGINGTADSEEGDKSSSPKKKTKS